MNSGASSMASKNSLSSSSSLASPFPGPARPGPERPGPERPGPEIPGPAIPGREMMRWSQVCFVVALFSAVVLLA